jgi:glutathione peroxidase
MRTVALLTMSVLLSVASCQNQESADLASKTNLEDASMGDSKHNEILFNRITGEEIRLPDLDGKAFLIVNVASECGYTPQYEGLETIYRKYKDQGLVVVGFPANNFGGQEPGTNEQILEFCETKFDVTFPMMEKVSVKGEDIHPFFEYLTEQASEPGEIKWNFSKFLLDADGHLVARFGSDTAPTSEELVAELDRLL